MTADRLSAMHCMLLLNWSCGDMDKRSLHKSWIKFFYIVIVTYTSAVSAYVPITITISIEGILFTNYGFGNFALLVSVINNWNKQGKISKTIVCEQNPFYTYCDRYWDICWNCWCVCNNYYVKKLYSRFM